MSKDNILIAGSAVIAWVGAALSGGIIFENSGEPPISAYPAYEDSYYPNKVSPGEEVIPDWMFNKRLDCPGKYARVWDADNGFHIPEGYRASAIGKTDGFISIHTPTTIPSKAPNGVVSLQIYGQVECPGMKPKPYTSEVMYFIVENGEPQPE
jgi:hypothetical protein